MIEYEVCHVCLFLFQFLLVSKIMSCFFQAGIQRLISKGIYKSAFPLHEGDVDYGDEAQNKRRMNARRVRTITGHTRPNISQIPSLKMRRFLNYEKFVDRQILGL